MFIETVGVGQSETLVSDMTDMFILIVSPGAGDELQGLKKGIVECADMVIVNKADGDLLPSARIAQLEYKSALKYAAMGNSVWKPPVILVSSAEKTGFETVWRSIKDYYNMLENTHGLELKRGDQRVKLMKNRVVDQLVAALESDERTLEVLQEMEHKVRDGRMEAIRAADVILDVFLARSSSN